MKIKNIYLLIPLYNDWISLKKLLFKINKNVKNIKANFNILVVNDCSSQKFKRSKYKFDNLKSIKIINLKKNIGHDRAIALGLNVLFKKKSFDYVITMDSDGEDNPIYIKSLINKIDDDKNLIIVTKRKQRSVSMLFNILYYLHLTILYTFVSKWINFGGYNCLSKDAVKNLIKERTLWGNYSATIANSNKKIKYLETDRSKRYHGPSQMNYFKLFLHSLSILAVFKKIIIIRILLLSLLNLMIIFFFKHLIYYIPLIILLLLATMVLMMSLRENNLWQRHAAKNILSINKFE